MSQNYVREQQQLNKKQSLATQPIEGKLLHYVSALPRLLLNLPASLRLITVVICTIVCQTLFILLVPMEQNPSLLAIPIVLSAWIYRKRGMLLCIAAETIATWIFYAIRQKQLWLIHGFCMNFIAGDLALLLIGLMISSQRDVFERVEESKRQIDSAYAKEQHLGQMKDQFIQSVNHELRTPLTALSGYLELLLERNEQFDAGTRANFLQNAILSCEELQLLMSNILDGLQNGHDKTFIQLTETHLASIIREVVQQSDPRWQLEQRMHLEISTDLYALTIQQYLRQILRNLLSNVVKYAPGEETILLTGRQVENPDTAQPEICISIQDSGPGIPANEIKQLFGQFTRLQRDSFGPIRGTGLGLYISKQLVETMGGRIWVESTGIPGEGSCFSFTLPAATSTPTTAISTFTSHDKSLVSQVY